MAVSRAEQWFPVATATDLVPRHVFQGELNDVELALWRDDDGCVNAWENRCMHRSVRLSLGVNTGRRLRCQYHGWQYRSGDGQCVVVPAASQTPPPASVSARTFAVAEQHGLIWANLYEPTGTPLNLSEHWQIQDDSQHPLRSFVLHGDAASVTDMLLEYQHCDGQLGASAVSTQSTPGALSLSWTEDGQAQRVVFMLQPARRHKTIVHTLLTVPPTMNEQQLARWELRHNQTMNRLRQRLVESGRLSHMPVPGQEFVPAPPRESTSRARARMFEARVTRRYDAAEGIVAFELEPENEADVGALADFMPGAHIDVTTPADSVRQYSIVSLPGETNASGGRNVPGITLGVKREEDSRGGSIAMHDGMHAGHRCRISRPKNHFRIANNRGALMLAGGIGMTPLVSMAQYMQAAERNYALHYFVRSEAHVAFVERLERLAHYMPHIGLSPQDTEAQLKILLAALDDNSDVYVCGPRPFLDAVVNIAEQVGVSNDRVHFELFSNTISHANDEAFRVRLARSDKELEVPANQSLADVLIDHGCAIETSCEQGVCGTCMVPVLEGEVEHRDVYLSADEKQANSCMQSCVSRAKSSLLILDL